MNIRREGIAIKACVATLLYVCLHAEVEIARDTFGVVTPVNM